jgi:hypothetical protein
MMGRMSVKSVFIGVVAFSLTLAVLLKLVDDLSSSGSKNNVVVMDNDAFESNYSTTVKSVGKLTLYKRLIVDIYTSKGFIVLDANTTLGYPDASLVEFPSEKMLIQTALSLGMDIELANIEKPVVKNIDIETYLKNIEDLYKIKN